MIAYSSNRTIKHVNHRTTIIEWSQGHRNIRHRLIQTALSPWVSDPVCKIKSCSELYKHLQHIEWYHKNQVFKNTSEWIFKSPPKKAHFGLHYLPANSLHLFAGQFLRSCFWSYDLLKVKWLVQSTFYWTGLPKAELSMCTCHSYELWLSTYKVWQLTGYSRETVSLKCIHIQIHLS